MNKTDVVIIGAGIAGLTAAIYLKRANVSFVVLEGSTPGGKLTKISEIENYPGFKSITGSELFAQLHEQIRQLGIEITYGLVQSVIKNENDFSINTDVDSYLCKALIVATGTIVKEGGVPGEKEYASRGVSYCATCDGNFFKGLPVAVIGNSEPAIEEALYLANIASKVYLLNDSDNFKASSSLIERVEQSIGIEVIKQVKLTTINGDDKGVSSISYIDNKKRENVIDVRGVFPLLGFKTSNQFLKEISPSSKNGYIIVDQDMMSNVPGLFAIGDVIDKKVRQLVTAASDGAVASNSIVKYLRNSKH